MLQAHSEIDRLKKVIIHAPDRGILRVTPKEAEELLFDDIAHWPLMKQEHQTFTDSLRKLIGQDGVVEFQDLLEESLNVGDKGSFIRQIIHKNNLPSKSEERLLSMDNNMLAEVLIHGYDYIQEQILFKPIPNLIFTRDIGVTIGNHFLITKAAKKARQRENILTKFIVDHHDLFQDVKANNRIIDMTDINKFPPSKLGIESSIEGGDVMIIKDDFLLIGCSERTTDHSFQLIKEELFRKDVVKFVVQVEIPNDRSFMHIDTLFTQVNTDLLACYKPIVYDGLGSQVKVYNRRGLEASFSSVKHFFLEMVNPDMKFVFSGGGEYPFQEREQWTDGCNLVAVSPGVAFTYDRNTQTNLEFEAKGYQVISANDFLNSQEPLSDKAIITLPSGELSRARGGSHCMTCPISRTK